MGFKNPFFSPSKFRLPSLTAFIFGLFVLFFFYKATSYLQVDVPNFYPNSKGKLHQSEVETRVLVHLPFYRILTLNLHGSKYAGVENYTNYYVAQYGLKTLDRIQPILPNLGPIINDCTSFEHPINIQSCLDQVHFNKTSIFISVISAPGNFEKRNKVRSTWKRNLYNDVVTGLIDVVGFAFLMGKTEDASIQASIQKENRKHGDIIQVNIDDSYKNLTLKTVSLLNWVVNYCTRVHFVLKVDDDVYLNVRNLAATIRALPPSEKSIYGRLIGGNAPYRQGSKWSYTFEMWPWNLLPKYIDGPAYLISGSAVTPLLASAQTTPFFVSEDLFISGLCSIKVNVTIHSSPNLLVHNPPEGKPDACFVKETTMWVSDSYSVSLMDISHELTEQFYSNNISCLTGNNSSVYLNAEDPNNFVAATSTLVLNPEAV